MTSQILNSMKESDRETLHSLKDIQAEQIDRWEQIIQNLPGVSLRSEDNGNESLPIRDLEERVKRIEEQSGEVKEKLDQLISLVSSKFGNSY